MLRSAFVLSEECSVKEFIITALFRPFVLFATEPIIQLVSVYLAFIYGVIYREAHLPTCFPSFRTDGGNVAVVITTIPPIFANIYHERPGHIGLHYIALGLGAYRQRALYSRSSEAYQHDAGLFIASQTNARVIDRVYVALKKRNNDQGEPEFRLRKPTLHPASDKLELTRVYIATVVPGTILIPAGLFMSGWGAQEHVHWIVPDIVSRALSIHRHRLTAGDVGLLLHRRGHGPHLPGHDVLRHRLVHDVRRIRFVVPASSAPNSR